MEMSRDNAKLMLKSTMLMLLGADNQPVSDLYYALQVAVECMDFVDNYIEKYNEMEEHIRVFMCATTNFNDAIKNLEKKNNE